LRAPHLARIQQQIAGLRNASPCEACVIDQPLHGQQTASERQLVAKLFRTLHNVSPKFSVFGLVITILLIAGSLAPLSLSTFPAAAFRLLMPYCLSQ
jgi:hypothetical protein